MAKSGPKPKPVVDQNLLAVLNDEVILAIRQRIVEDVAYIKLQTEISTKIFHVEKEADARATKSTKHQEWRKIHGGRRPAGTEESFMRELKNENPWMSTSTDDMMNISQGLLTSTKVTRQLHDAVVNTNDGTEFFAKAAAELRGIEKLIQARHEHFLEKLLPTRDDISNRLYELGFKGGLKKLLTTATRRRLVEAWDKQCDLRHKRNDQEVENRLPQLVLRAYYPESPSGQNPSTMDAATMGRTILPGPAPTNASQIFDLGPPPAVEPRATPGYGPSAAYPSSSRHDYDAALGQAHLPPMRLAPSTLYPAAGQGPGRRVQGGVPAFMQAGFGYGDGEDSAVRSSRRRDEEEDEDDWEHDVRTAGRQARHHRERAESRGSSASRSEEPVDVRGRKRHPRVAVASSESRTSPPGASPAFSRSPSVHTQAKKARVDHHDSSSVSARSSAEKDRRTSDRHEKRSDRHEKDCHEKKPDRHEKDRHEKKSDRHEKKSDRHEKKSDRHEKGRHEKRKN